jgi:hypothetical protein
MGRELDDPQDAPCLEDRVPTPDVEVSDHLSSEGEDDTSSNEDNNHDDDCDSHPSRGNLRRRMFTLSTKEEGL